MAERCIEKSAKPKRQTNRWTDEKYMEVLDRWRRGDITKTALGKQYNVCCTQMRYIISKAERIERKRSNSDKCEPGSRHDYSGESISL